MSEQFEFIFEEATCLFKLYIRNSSLIIFDIDGLKEQEFEKRYSKRQNT
jgi:hypothetical protein